MNTFDWVVCGIAGIGLVGWLLLRWIMSGKDSLR
jgi:hypothetical protein